jgi:hypothetical protein
MNTTTTATIEYTKIDPTAQLEALKAECARGATESAIDWYLRIKKIDKRMEDQGTDIALAILAQEGVQVIPNANNFIDDKVIDAMQRYPDAFPYWSTHAVTNGDECDACFFEIRQFFLYEAKRNPAVDFQSLADAMVSERKWAMFWKVLDTPEILAQYRQYYASTR